MRGPARHQLSASKGSDNSRREFVTRLTFCALVLSLLAGTADAQSPNPVKIGVLNDQSGIYADLAGPGSVIAARLAVEDAGGVCWAGPLKWSLPIIRASPTLEQPLRVAGKTLTPFRLFSTYRCLGSLSPSRKSHAKRTG